MVLGVIRFIWVISVIRVISAIRFLGLLCYEDY